VLEFSKSFISGSIPIIKMIIKECEFCKKNIKTKLMKKRFCNRVCQRKHYVRRPEVKKKARIMMGEYRRTHPEWKERHLFLALTRYRKKRAEYWKEYGKRPEVRAKIRETEKLRRETDPEFAIRDRLRRSLRHALSKYSRIGKIMESKKYGINWEEIIDNLKPFPKNLKNFEIDHITPLHTFNLTNSEEVKKAFNPSNLQWLTREENRKKSGKLITKNYKSGVKNAPMR